MHASRFGTPLMRRPDDFVGLSGFHARRFLFTDYIQYMFYCGPAQPSPQACFPKVDCTTERALALRARALQALLISRSARSLLAGSVGPRTHSCASWLQIILSGSLSVAAHGLLKLIYALPDQISLARIPFPPLDQWVDSRALPQHTNPFGRMPRGERVLWWQICAICTPKTQARLLPARTFSSGAPSHASAPEKGGGCRFQDPLDRRDWIEGTAASLSLLSQPLSVHSIYTNFSVHRDDGRPRGVKGSTR